MNWGARLAVRTLRRYPWRSALAVAGIALGIAVVLAIDLTNESAWRALRLANDAVAGGSTHYIDGGPAGIDETLYVKLRKEHGMRNVYPVVSGYVLVDEERFLLLGIDPFASPYAAARRFGAGPPLGAQLLGGHNAAAVLKATAARLGIAPPAPLVIRAGGIAHELEVVATIEPRDELERYGLGSVIITDIATAQPILGLNRKLSRIDLDTDDPAGVAALLPSALAVIPSSTRSQSMQQMTRAFHLNLTALSLLALVIGSFLIYNTMTLSVLQRRERFAVLRTLGVTPRQLFANVLTEAMLIGVVGVVVGGAAGLWLSGALLSLVSGTINDLYFSIEVRDVSVSALSVAKAAALGLIGTLLAAWHPSWDAMRTPPAVNARRSRVESDAHKRAFRLLLLGLSAWVCAGLVLTGSAHSIVAGFGALFLVIIGFALATPAALLALLKLSDNLADRLPGVLGRMAVRGVRASLSRTQIAVAALAIAVSAVIGVSVMISSFRLTVEHWLHNFLRADVYIAQEHSQPYTGIDRALVDEIASLPEVTGLSTGRWVTLERADGFTQLFAVDLDRRGFRNFQLKNGDSAAVWPVFSGGDAVIVSEPYAYHNGVVAGDSIVLPTAQGDAPFVVAGVFYDYGSDRGVVAMHRNTYDRHWHDPVISSFALYLTGDTDVESFVARLNRNELADRALRVRSNRTLRRASLQIFDRTFVITDILRMLAVVIAVVGVFTALMAIQLERAAEFAVLRAAGLSVRQLFGLISAECGLMGLAAGVIACPLGLVTAWMLVAIINLRSFGWTMQFQLDAEPLLTALALSTIAALVAGVYPAWRMSRAAPADALKYE